MDPLVSFVIPCFDYGRYLADCLTSVFSQEGRFTFEIIAVDDASTDNTREVLESFRDPRLRVITHPVNLGHVASDNEGFSVARGTFIARLAQDDRLRPCFLAAMLEKFRAFPEVGLVYGDVALIDERGEITRARCDRLHGGRDFKGNEFLALLSENFICSSAAIGRREAWQRVLPAPADFGLNDWYLTLMMARQFDFYYVDRVVAEYRAHGANLHTRIAREKKQERMMFSLLDRVFNEVEARPGLEEGKQRIRRRVYAAQYLTAADKYFGLRMDADARRCYLAALRHRPRYALHLGVLRRLVGTFLGRRIYERSKSMARSVLGPGPGP